MIILVHSAPVSLLRDHGRHPHLGVLVSPRGSGSFGSLSGWTWAADNDAYSGFHEGRYRRMLDAIAGVPGCRFVTAPDVVADAAATADLFAQWAPDLRASFPVAYVAQDGSTVASLPWRSIDALFIGGTNRFKLGADALPLVREARRLGLWVHMGRVNTHRRIRYAMSLGCQSCDGTNFSRYRRTKLPAALAVAAQEPQLGIQF